MAAVIYARQSLDKTGDGLGIARQVEACQQLCEARSWPVTTIIEDNDRSASRGVREGYAELLAMIENRAVDRVVVLRLDRLLRRVTDLEALIELTERTGVKITTVEGDLDLSNPSGRLMGRIMASVARGEIETKSARQKLANAQAAAAGKPHGSRRPYGYEADLMTVYEPEARILHTMAARVIAGHSCKEVAYWAHEHGYTTTMGKPFYPLTVRNMLMKKRYAGIREYEGAEYPAAWQPVFDPQTWQRLQLTLKLRRDRYADAATVKPRKYLLTGLAYCGKCGRPMNGSAKRDRAGAPLRRTYLCRVQGDTRREGGCGGVRRNADALDNWIKEAVLYRLDTPQLAKLLRGGDAEHVNKMTDLLNIRTQHVNRIDMLVDDYATRLLTRAQFARAKQTAEAELRRIEHEISQHSHAATAGGLISAGQSVREFWETCESDESRRSLLSLLIEKITVMPGRSKPFMMVNGQRMRFDPSLIQIAWRA